MLTHEQILRKTINYCKKLGIKELEINKVGKFPEPTDIILNMRNNKLPEVITYSVLKTFASYACEKNPFEAVNYFAHYGRSKALRDLHNIGFPEYIVQELIYDGYLESRRKDIHIFIQEKLLKDSLISLEKKYGKQKVKQLKKRLGISDINENLLKELGDEEI